MVCAFVGALGLCRPLYWTEGLSPGPVVSWRTLVLRKVVAELDRIRGEVAASSVSPGLCAGAQIWVGEACALAHSGYHWC